MVDDSPHVLDGDHLAAGGLEELVGRGDCRAPQNPGWFRAILVLEERAASQSEVIRSIVSGYSPCSVRGPVIRAIVSEDSPINHNPR